MAEITKIISRKDAHAQNLTFYFTGEPCKHGHISKRYVIGMICKACKDQWNRPVRAAPNVANGPSPLVFPADVPTPLTPELVNTVWGYVLELMPALTNRAMIELGMGPLKGYQAPTPAPAAAVVEGAQPSVNRKTMGDESYQAIKERTGLSDLDLYVQGALNAPEGMSSDDYMDALMEYGSHAECVRMGVVPA